MSLQPRPTGRTTGRLTGRISNRLSGQLTHTTPSPFPVPLKSSNPAAHVGLAPDPQTLAPAPKSPLVRAQQAVRLNTLAGQFNALAGLCIGVALLAMTVSFSGFNSSANDLRGLVANAAPSIVAADDLSRELDDLDTRAADLFIVNYYWATNEAVYNGIKLTPEKALADYNTARRNVNDSLLTAYANATFRGEAPTLRLIADRIEEYSRQIGQMQGELTNKHYEGALADYKYAHDLVIGNSAHANLNTPFGLSAEETLKLNGWQGLNPNSEYDGLEANARRLYEINRQQLDNYSRQAQDHLAANQILTLLTSLLLVIALAALVIRYALTTHRALNPGYAIALLGALVMLFVTSATLNSTSQDLKTIAQDSFVSIDDAGQTQQFLRDFNGDESRLLMNPAFLKLNLSDPALTSAVQKAFDPNMYYNNFTRKKQLVLDDVRRAWANVTYADERTALCSVYDNKELHYNAIYQDRACYNNTNNSFSLISYFDQHDKIVNAFKQNDPATALQISYGQSNFVADKTSEGLSQLAEVNKRAFDIAACNSVGESQFDHSCQSVKAKQGLVVEKYNAPNANLPAWTGYLDGLQGWSVVVFLVLGLVTAAGVRLSRRLF